MQHKAFRQADDLQAGHHSPAQESAFTIDGSTELQSPTRLLGNSSLGGRGNTAVRAAAMQQAQQTHGNRAVQRFMHRSMPCAGDVTLPVQREPDNDWARRQAQVLTNREALGPTHLRLPAYAQSTPNQLSYSNPYINAAAREPIPTSMSDAQMQPLVDQLPASSEATPSAEDSNDASAGGDDSGTGITPGGATVRLGPHATGSVTTSGISTSINEHGVNVSVGGNYDGTLNASVGQAARAANANRSARPAWNVGLGVNPSQHSASVDTSYGPLRAGASGGVGSSGPNAGAYLGWGYRPDQGLPNTAPAGTGGQSQNPRDAAIASVQAAGGAGQSNTPADTANPDRDAANRLVSAAITRATGSHGPGAPARSGQHAPVNPHPHDPAQQPRSNSPQGPSVGADLRGGIDPQTGTTVGGNLYWRLPDMPEAH